jgi:hypothetical protein
VRLELILRCVKPLRVDVRLVVVLLYLVAMLLMSVPPPRLAHMLRLSGKVTKPLGRHHHILLPYVGWCRL